MGEIIRLAPRLHTPRDRALDLHATLIGAKLRWKRYRAWNAAWLPARCELCHTPFAEGEARNTLHSGYSVAAAGPAGRDDYFWICAVCFEDRQAWFGWQVLDENGARRGQGDQDGRRERLA